MTENLLRKKYFLWMCQIVDTNVKIRGGSYRSLLEELNSIDFYAVLPMDENRADDGIELRYRFGRDCGYPASAIASMLDVRPCSVLEMMVALALRGEHHVAEDTIYGDRTERWFWSMIKSMALTDQYDDVFDPVIVRDSVHRMLERNYASNGRGGLFTLKNPREDLRYVEIWYQMMWYLNEVL